MNNNPLKRPEIKEKLYFSYIIIGFVIVCSLICSLKEIGLIPNGYKEFSPKQYEISDEYQWNISADRYKILDCWYTEARSWLNQGIDNYYHIYIDDAYVISVQLPEHVKFDHPVDLTGSIEALPEELIPFEADEILDEYEYVYEAVMAADYKSTPKRVLGAIGYITIGFIASLLLYRIFERQKMIQNYYSSLSDDDIDDI